MTEWWGVHHCTTGVNPPHIQGESPSGPGVWEGLRGWYG